VNDKLRNSITDTSACGAATNSGLTSDSAHRASHTKFWIFSSHHSEDLGVEGRIILKWILGNKVGSCELDASGLG
jgi:hypothetical protein